MESWDGAYSSGSHFGVEVFCVGESLQFLGILFVSGHGVFL